MVTTMRSVLSPPPTLPHTPSIPSPLPPAAHRRVPIIKCIDSATGLAVDISIDNRRARVKTMLLSSYAKCDERSRQLMFVVKRWAMVRAIIEPRSNFPNSYTWCQLVIAYLQGVGVLPVLTQLSGKHLSQAISGHVSQAISGHAGQVEATSSHHAIIDYVGEADGRAWAIGGNK